MDLQLNRDIVFFDIEATGLHVIRDRIIQIAMIKYHKDGRQETYSQLINPGIPISEEAMQVVSITPADLRNKPTFSQVGQKIYDFIGDADLGGYGMYRLDIPMLIEEFGRMGLDFDISRRSIVDAQKIFYKMEPRTLAAALKFYCDEELDNAHDALVDVKATVDVLKGQLERYQGISYQDQDGNGVENPIKNDMKAIHEFINDPRSFDPTQKLKYDMNGQIVFNFGKHAGKAVGPFLYKDRQYYNWILEKEFSYQVKQTVRKEVEKYAKEIKDKQ